MDQSCRRFKTTMIMEINYVWIVFTRWSIIILVYYYAVQILLVLVELESEYGAVSPYIPALDDILTYMAMVSNELF